MASATNVQPEAVPEPRASLAAWYALGVLTVVTFFALVDRQVLLLVAEPLRQQFRLSDLQVGLLQGSGIAIFTAIASYPLGWLADRIDRRRMLALCVLVWSVAVLACGLAQSFEGLFIASALVGAGEAGLAPAVYAMLPLLFLGRQRQFANSIFALVSIGGGALSLAFTGLLVGAASEIAFSLPPPLQGLEGWRLSFIAAALPAPLMMILILTIRLPARPLPVPVPGTSNPMSLSIWPTIKAHRGTFIRLYAGVAMSGAAFGAVIVWLAILAPRLFGATPAQVGAALGTAQLASAAGGFGASILVTHWLEPRRGPAFAVRGMWLAVFASIPACLSLVAVTSAMQLYTVYAVYGIALTLQSMLYPTALQNVTPPELRGRAIALQYILTMIGASLAPPLVGFISDVLGPDPRSPLIAIACVAVPLLVGAGMLLRSAEGPALDRAIAGAG